MNFRQQKFDQARQFVQAGLYDDAESVLKRLGDDPKAKAWLNRLKKYRSGELPGNDTEMPELSDQFFGAPRLAMNVITINVILSAIVLGFMFVPRIEFSQVIILIIFLLISIILALIFQVLFYNLYWWIMAILWTLISIGLIYALFMGINLIMLK